MLHWDSREFGLPRIQVSPSTSLAVVSLLHGPRRHGVALGRGYVETDGYVLALVPPGRPRMPNGIVCDLTPNQGEFVSVGGGRVETREGIVVDGELWDPVPEPRVMLDVEPSFVPDPYLLAGRGSGLTPSGDDLLAGYAAGLVLWHHRMADADVIARAAAPRTTALSGTLLWHASRAELPEPAHALVEDANPAPLAAFGRSSGAALLVGLALGCVGFRSSRAVG